MNKILQSAKAVASLVGAVAASLVAGLNPDSESAHIIAIVIAVCTGIATWVVPNAEAE